VKIIEEGGNRSLHSFFQLYGLGSDCPWRYKTKAAEFYRMKVIATLRSHG